jgi:hypothetical protein
MQKRSCVSYLDGFPVGAGLPELDVLKDGVHVVGVHDVLGLALHTARGGAVELLLVTPATHLSLLSELRIRIRDPVPFDPWIPGPGWVKNQRMKNPVHILESFKTIFWVKILIFFDADPG